MEWIATFFWFFVIPLGICTFYFSVAWLVDNTSYPWKGWTKEGTIGAFSIGPAVGFLIFGCAMIRNLRLEIFIFERWWTATSSILLGIWIFGTYSRKFGTEHSPEERERRRRLQEEYEKAHPDPPWQGRDPFF
jgi:hypothetical protein